MSEKEMNNQEPIFMEPAEYMSYLENQIKRTPEQEKRPIAQVNMYELNKSMVKNLKKMNNMEVNRALEKVAEWFDPDEDYYALLNHEHHYFTVFHLVHRSFDPKCMQSNFIREVKDVLTNDYGDKDLRAIDIDPHGGAVEIWSMWDGEPTVAYLFPYSRGVVDF